MGQERYARAYDYLGGQLPMMKDYAKKFCEAHPHLSIDLINTRSRIQLACHCNTLVDRRPSGLLTIRLQQQIRISILNQEEIDLFEESVNGIITLSEGRLSKSTAHGNPLTTQDEKVIGFLSMWYFISPKIAMF